MLTVDRARLSTISVSSWARQGNFSHILARGLSPPSPNATGVLFPAGEGRSLSQAAAEFEPSSTLTPLA
eukprot:10507422-Alexandrium_andersonii.AAC.1